MDALGRKSKHRLGELIADAVHALPCQQQVEAPGCRVVAAERRARLDRRRHQSVVDELDLDDVGGSVEHRPGGVSVSPLKSEAEIARSFIPDRRRARQQRRRGINDRVERPVLDNDALGGIARLVAGFRHGQRHRIADMAHPAACQRIARRHNHRIYGGDLSDAWQRTEIVGAQIGFGEHAAHAGGTACRHRIDALDFCVGMRGAQHMSIELPGQTEIVRVPAAPGQKPKILEPAKRAFVIIVCHRDLPQVAVPAEWRFATRPPMPGNLLDKPRS